MKKSKPTANDMKRHQQTQQDAMDDDIKYTEPNRDRAVGHVDRTGRHFDELTDDSISDDGNPVRDAD